MKVTILTIFIVLTQSAFANQFVEYKSPFGVDLGKPIPVKYSGTWHTSAGYEVFRYIKNSDENFNEYLVKASKITKTVVSLDAIFKDSVSCEKQKQIVTKIHSSNPEMKMESYQYRNQTLIKLSSDGYTVSPIICNKAKGANSILYYLQNTKMNQLLEQEQAEYEENGYVLSTSRDDTQQ